MFQVQRVRCSTCIYKKTSTLNLDRLEDAVRDNHGGFKDYRACHHASSNVVCCRGFWDHHRDDFQLGQIAQRFNAVEFVDVDDLKDR
jgi:hypothetical protein